MTPNSHLKVFKSNLAQTDRVVEIDHEQVDTEYHISPRPELVKHDSGIVKLTIRGRGRLDNAPVLECCDESVGSARWNS